MNHQCEYCGFTGHAKCPNKAIIPLRINNHPWLWYCPNHARIIHDFLKGTPPRTQTQAWHNNTASIIGRQTARDKRRKRLLQILATIQPTTSGRITKYAKALDTTPRTIRNDLTHFKKQGLATSEYNNKGNGRTQEWRTKRI